MFSKLFDPVDLTSYLSKVVRLLRSTTLSIEEEKTDSPPKNLRWSKLGGGVKGKYDRGQRFNGFVDGFP